MADGFTFFIYLTVLVTTVSLAYLAFNRYANLPKRISNTLVIVIFFILTLIGGLRYDVGRDYHSYERLFTERPWVENEYDKAERDIGFMAVVDGLNALEVESWVVFLFFSAMTFLVFLKAFKKFQNLIMLGLFFFITLGFFFYTFNGIRQMFALMMMFLSMRFVQDRRIIPFIVSILIGASIHKSLIIFLPFYFFINKPLFKGDLWIFIGITSVFLGVALSLVFSSFIGAINVITESVEFGYSSAINKSSAGSFMSMLSPIFLSKVIIGLTIIYFKDKLVSRFPLSIPFVNMSVMGSLIYNVFSQVQFVSRFNTYFQFMNVITLAFLITLWVEKGQIYHITAIIIYSLAFYFLIIFQGDSGSAPYQFISF